MLRKFFQNRPELKSPRELGLMREAGKIVAAAHRIARELAPPGRRNHRNRPGRRGSLPPPRRAAPIQGLSRAKSAISGGDLHFRERAGGSRHSRPPGFEGRRYRQVRYRVQAERLVRDAAVTLLMGEVRPEMRRLIQTAWETLKIAIDELGRRKWWTEVALKMQQHVERAGFSVVTQYVGHGIGRIMHEPPQVPNYVNHEVKKHDFRIEPGLVLAVEPMVNLGRRGDVDMIRDHWTVVTRDRLPSAHVEHTVAITAEGV